jgi:methylated-DNA-[protein]-cysteine S-methyltransferase
MIHFRTIDSPIGPLALAGQGRVLTHLRMLNQTYEPNRSGWVLNDRAFSDVADQLEAYFAGERSDSISISSWWAANSSAVFGRRC